MQRLVLLLILFTCSGYISSAQHDLRLIKATDPWVDIRVGDGYFIKHGWHLEPEKNPDVFSIGSKWPYKYKRLSFITDIDSISFDVQPGGRYDFIIVLNNTARCHIRVVTIRNPVFLQATIFIPIAFGFMAVIVFVYAYRKKVSTVGLLTFGYLAPSTFWAMTFLSGNIHGHYNFLKNVVSELGALGTTSEIVTSASLVLIALLNLLFSIGFYLGARKLQMTTIPSLLSFTMPFSSIWAAFFPLGNEFHSATGPLPLFVIVGSLIGFLFWKDEKIQAPVRLFSLISFLIMILVLLRFVQPFGYRYEGLVQRFFYLGWTIWYVSISFFFRRRLVSAMHL